ncbi:MAG TPA: PAC2 family protein [Methanomassiliicoccales archaeon]|nr:PAC2 family protein [Methanomassiliicoccales archaeon]
MNGIDIIDIKEKNIKGAYVFDGFPSVGLVGSIVANYLVSFLNLEQIAIVDSVYFPSISLIREGAPLSPVRVYGGSLGTKGQEKVVVFVSEFQPAQDILKTLAITMMDWVEDHKCKMVISPEGLLSKEESERMEAYAQTMAANKDVAEYVVSGSNNKQAGEGINVLGVGSTPAARQVLKQIDVKSFENGVIAGLAGVLLNEGVARDFDVITLLSEAHAEYPDARAAAAIMTVIDRMLLHVELDLKPLLQEAALIEDTLKDIQKKAATEDETSKKKSSYMYS